MLRFESKGERQGGKSDHITSPGASTAKTVYLWGPAQWRREHRAVRRKSDIISDNRFWLY
jgi:hypothetical protein